MSDTVLPGDKIALIEECEAGKNSYDDDGLIRSMIVGKSEMNKKERLVDVENQKVLSVPNADDIIIGTIEMVTPSMIEVLINYINGKPVKSQVECICSIRNLRKRSPALIRDVVKARVIGTLNGVIHATIQDKELGVLFTKCRKCGHDVVLFRDIVKCIECGWTDDRKISTDFLQSNFLKMRE